MNSLTKELIKINSSKLSIPTSNWIDERVATGGYPGHEDEEIHLNQLGTLILANINHIICLQEVDETPEYREYKEQMKAIGTTLHHFPIKDYDTLETTELQNIIDKINNILNENDTNIIYIHCKGGHGRTGLIACLFLKQKHNLTNHDSLELWHNLHDRRKKHTITKNGKKGRLSSKQIASLNSF